MHSGHRKRMREKMLEEGEFPSHELLEMLLAYAIPRKNTNELAHRLLMRFGTLEGVFGASYDDLLSVRGMGEQSAFLLRLSAITFRRLRGDVCDVDVCLDSVSKLGKYGEVLFHGATEESVYAALLDSRLHLIGCVRLAGGNSFGAEIGLDSISRDPAIKRSTAAVIFHNHPDGTLDISDEDRDFVVRVAELFAMEGVEVMEQIVVAGENHRVLVHDRRLGFPVDKRKIL